jgi:hypothetical protein
MDLGKNQLLKPLAPINLWDMIRLFIGDICRRIIDIEEVVEKYKRATLGDGDFKLTPNDFKEIERLMRHFEVIADWLLAPTTRYQGDALRKAIHSGGGNTAKGIGLMLECAYSRMKYDMNQIVAVRIPDDGIKHYEQEKLFGVLVWSSFPSAREDIRVAGNCLAVGFDTASVFHSMRVVELGMRAVAEKLNVKIKNRGIESADWGTIIKAIRLKIEVLQEKFDKSKRKKMGDHKKLEFLRATTDEMNVFRAYWRNNTMHTRASYTPEEAAAVLERVRYFMTRLSENGIMD